MNVNSMDPDQLASYHIVLIRLNLDGNGPWSQNLNTNLIQGP